MATLKAMFKLFDGYSSTISKINKKTDEATNKILNASGATDKFNKKLENTGASANTASSGLGKLVKTFISLAAIKKGMDIVDEYTNTASRLALINDGLQTQAKLQDKIFAAANRSRGAYGDMADAIAKMGLMARDAFSVDGKLNTDELVAFTELVQKSFKIAGASISEQQAAMRQLAQAMASGRLQGDELVSIMENAPMIYEAIAKYMGKTKAELKELSSKGAITADIIKNAMFAAADDINKKFEKMPMTFADIWNKIKNGALKAFRPVMKKISNLINSEDFQKFINGFISGLATIADVAVKAVEGVSKLFNFISKNWGKLAPIIFGVAAAWLYFRTVLMHVRGALVLVQLAQWALNLAQAANPIGIIIILLGVLIAIFVILWEKCEGFRSFWTKLWAHNAKTLVRAYNAYVTIYNKLAEVWNHVIDDIKKFNNFYRKCMLIVVAITAAIAKAIISAFEPILKPLNDLISTYNAVAKFFGKKTIDVKFTSKNTSKLIDKVASDFYRAINVSADLVNSSLEKAKIDPLKTLNTERFDKIVDYASDKIKDFTLTGWLKDTYEKYSKELKDAINNPFEYDPNKYNTPLTVEGTGDNNAVEVEMSDEDLKYLRDIAERDYINKFTTVTLAPQTTVQFGDVHEEADVNKVAARIRKILREEIAMAAEGAY